MTHGADAADAAIPLAEVANAVGLLATALQTQGDLPESALRYFRDSEALVMWQRLHGAGVDHADVRVVSALANLNVAAVLRPGSIAGPDSLHEAVKLQRQALAMLRRLHWHGAAADDIMRSRTSRRRATSASLPRPPRCTSTRWRCFDGCTGATWTQTEPSA